MYIGNTGITTEQAFKLGEFSNNINYTSERSFLDDFCLLMNRHSINWTDVKITGNYIEINYRPSYGSTQQNTLTLDSNRAAVTSDHQPLGKIDFNRLFFEDLEYVFNFLTEGMDFIIASATKGWDEFNKNRLSQLCSKFYLRLLQHRPPMFIYYGPRHYFELMPIDKRDVKISCENIHITTLPISRVNEFLELIRMK